MNTTNTTYRLGDLSNGDFATFNTEAEAITGLKGAINEGTHANMESIGEEGSPWVDTDEAREAAEGFFYVRKHTVTLDEDGDIIDEDYKMIYGTTW